LRPSSFLAVAPPSNSQNEKQELLHHGVTMTQDAVTSEPVRCDSRFGNSPLQFGTGAHEQLLWLNQASPTVK
jgi:hypothetical protein